MVKFSEDSNVGMNYKVIAFSPKKTKNKNKKQNKTAKKKTKTKNKKNKNKKTHTLLRYVLSPAIVITD